MSRAVQRGFRRSRHEATCKAIATARGRGTDKRWLESAEDTPACTARCVSTDPGVAVPYISTGHVHVNTGHVYVSTGHVYVSTGHAIAIAQRNGDGNL
eukprot:1032097-Rhodomonas_salina.5